MTDVNSIAAIVLAAGQATRLGEPKQLLPVDGQPLLSRTLSSVRQSSLCPRILVLGAYAGEVATSVDTEGFEIVINERFAEGQSTSLVAGLRQLPDDSEGAVVFLADQPLIPADLVAQLVSAFEPSKHVAVRPNYANGPGNPILLSRAIFPELLDLTGDTGARSVLKKHRDQIIDIDATNRPIPLDVDTREDYVNLLANWSALGAPDIPRYCQRCGSGVALTERHGRLRPVCPVCDFTYLYDPKVAVAVIVEIDGKVVMQCRTIDPGRGKWTFPSGFVDRGEIIEQAARREVREETGLNIEDLELLGVYSAIGETVTLIVFSTKVTDQIPQIGDESSEVGMFSPGNLPDLAFPRDERILNEWRSRRRTYQ